MPKIIKDAKETILSCAKKHILEQDEKLSLRQIAKECGIAVGTIYNYFPDKTSLLVGVMLKDWRGMLARLDNSVETCTSMQEGLNAVYDTVHDFRAMYHNVFMNFTSDGKALGVSSNRHTQLRQELESRVKVVLKRFGKDEDQNISCLLTETVMTCSVQDDLSKEMLWDYVRRLF